MYRISEHYFGRAMIQSGPMAGCLGFEEHAWRGIGKARSKSSAIAMADACEHRAVVVKAHTSTTVYDNGKAPGPRNNTDPRPDPHAARTGDHFAQREAEDAKGDAMAGDRFE